MKPKRFYFRSTPLFGTPLRYGAPVFAGLVVFLTGLECGRPRHPPPQRRPPLEPRPPPPAAVQPSPAPPPRPRAPTPRTSCAAPAQTLDAMRAMQAAARAAAQQRPRQPRPRTCPVVPNGLRPGGLNPAADAATNPATWSGASQPVETV